ncbi:MAG TPA: hypothetical protein VEH07_00385 [Alphaproteobacteria bacterium]|nr:hypothetical protein [Alphaproteobacteria bacterium]
MAGIECASDELGGHVLGETENIAVKVAHDDLTHLINAINWTFHDFPPLVRSSLSIVAMSLTRM